MDESECLNVFTMYSECHIAVYVHPHPLSNLQGDIVHARVFVTLSTLEDDSASVHHIVDQPLRVTAYTRISMSPTLSDHEVPLASGEMT